MQGPRCLLAFTEEVNTLSPRQTNESGRSTGMPRGERDQCCKFDTSNRYVEALRALPGESGGAHVP